MLGWSTTSKLVVAMKPSWTSEIQCTIGERLRSGISTQSETKYFQQSLSDLLTLSWEFCSRCMMKSGKNWNTCCKSWLLQIEIGWSKEILSTKVEDSYFEVGGRDVNRLATGTSSKGKTRGKGKEPAKNNPERGDCIRWITKDPRSHGVACEERKAKGVDNFAHLLRQCSPRNSEGDGKGSDDGSAKGKN